MSKRKTVGLLVLLAVLCFYWRILLPSLCTTFTVPAIAIHEGGNHPENRDMGCTHGRLKASEQKHMERRRYALTHPEFKSEFYGKGYIWDYFRPTFACPHTTQAVGFGGGSGGGKWICGLDLYEDTECLVYSFGAGGESSFEAELLQRTKCQIFVFDGTPSGRLGPEINALPQEMRKRIKFSKLNGGAVDKDKKSITLASAMKANKHDFIDILKVDIEGAEFDMIHQILDTFPDSPPFAQLALEVHLDFQIPTKGRKSNFEDVVALWEAMESKGLRAFNSDGNIVYGVGGPYKMFAIEYAFINVKRRSAIVPSIV